MITSSYNSVYEDIFKNRNNPEKDLLYYKSREFYDGQPIWWNLIDRNPVKRKSISFEDYLKIISFFWNRK